MENAYIRPFGIDIRAYAFVVEQGKFLRTLRQPSCATNNANKHGSSQQVLVNFDPLPIEFYLRHILPTPLRTRPLARGFLCALVVVDVISKLLMSLTFIANKWSLDHSTAKAVVAKIAAPHRTVQDTAVNCNAVQCGGKHYSTYALR